MELDRKMKKHGFTLVELMISVLVTSIVVIAAYSLLRGTTSNFNNEDDRVQLRANLRIFLQSSSVLLMVDKGFSHIAKADRLSLLRIAAACSPRDRRCKVRSENERISFPVKELIQIPGRDGPDLIAENIKEFEGRRLNLPVPVGGKDMAQLPQQNLSLLTLLSIDIPYALRRVQYLLIHWIFLCNHSLRFIVVKR